jgi:Protein of unknown function (DUF2490)
MPGSDQRRSALFHSLLAICLVATARGQSSETETQFWPEGDVYVTLNPQTRFLYTLRDQTGPGNSSSMIANSLYIEYFLPKFHPVLFREIIKLNDARIQRIVIDLGERVINSVDAHPSSFEKRTIVQASLRWAFPFGALLTARSRGEFRFVNGVYSRRAREQLKVEKDIRIKGYALTEYVSAEGFFDSKTDSVDRFRYTAGVVLPVAKKTTIEPYFMRQDSPGAHPRYLQAIGCRLAFFVPKWISF